MNIFSKIFKSQDKKVDEIIGFDRIVLSVMHWLYLYQLTETDPLRKGYLNSFMRRSRPHEVFSIIKSCIGKYDGKIFKDDWDGQGEILDRIANGLFISSEQKFLDFVVEEIIRPEREEHKAFLCNHKEDMSEENIKKDLMAIIDRYEPYIDKGFDIAEQDIYLSICDSFSDEFQNLNLYKVSPIHYSNIRRLIRLGLFYSMGKNNVGYDPNTIGITEKGINRLKNYRKNLNSHSIEESYVLLSNDGKLNQ